MEKVTQFGSQIHEHEQAASNVLGCATQAMVKARMALINAQLALLSAKITDFSCMSLDSTGKLLHSGGDVSNGTGEGSDGVAVFRSSVTQLLDSIGENLDGLFESIDSGLNFTQSFGIVCFRHGISLLRNNMTLLFSEDPCDDVFDAVSFAVSCGARAFGLPEQTSDILSGFKGPIE